MVEFFFSAGVQRAILITGIINIVFGLALFSGCRFMPLGKHGKAWMNNRYYKAWYKNHSLLWWVFIPSLMTHFVFTMAHVFIGG